VPSQSNELSVKILMSCIKLQDFIVQIKALAIVAIIARVNYKYRQKI
jgi:hypothetical protein